MLSALPSLSSQPTSASSMLASVGLTLNVQVLPPSPDFSAIEVAEALAMMNGTLARSTSGMMASAAELQRPSKIAAYFLRREHLGDALHRLGRIAAVVLEIDLDLAAVDAALGVGLLDRELGAPPGMLAVVRDGAGERCRGSDHDRRLGEGGGSKQPAEDRGDGETKKGHADVLPFSEIAAVMVR